MIKQNKIPNFLASLRHLPNAIAKIGGSREYPDISGEVCFYKIPEGTLVVVAVAGLPKPHEHCKSPIFAFHVHDGGSCSGTLADPFANAGAHYNPHGCPHPYHSGDLPPLFGAGGYAFSAVLTDRFTVEDIIGKTVIIHSSPDDFMTQPSGNAGTKLACGEIVATRRRGWLK